MKTFKLNPEFANKVSQNARKRWAAALRKAAREGIQQRTGGMFAKNQHGTYMCCLMVGHTAWKGTDAQRDKWYPIDGPFYEAMNECENPAIATVKSDYMESDPVSAGSLNDEYKLSFLQIADILSGKEVRVEG